MATKKVADVVLARVRARGSATSSEIAADLGVPERTARRRLANLYAEDFLTREGVWVGSPPTFAWRYALRGKR